MNQSKQTLKYSQDETFNRLDYKYKCNISPCFNLCHHLATCPCPDYVKRKFIWKHIHKIHSQIKIHPSEDCGTNFASISFVTPSTKKNVQPSQQNILERFKDALDMIRKWKAQ